MYNISLIGLLVMQGFHLGKMVENNIYSNLRNINAIEINFINMKIIDTKGLNLPNG